MRVLWSPLLTAALVLSTLGLAGCGKQPPREAKQLVEEAGYALKGEKPKLEYPETTDDSATIKAKFDDGSELDVSVVKDGADWVLDACDAADATGLTDNCVPTETASVDSPFMDCIIGLADAENLWTLCDPLIDPETKAAAEETWNSCRAENASALQCALRVGISS